MSGVWVSQAVGALGATKAEGIRNQLGRPTLDRLTVLIRESAQNSWDARDPDTTGPVRYSVELLRLGPERGLVWRDLLRETSEMRGVRVGAALSEPDPWLLLVSDRGTVGLGGPTRGDLQRDDLPKNYTSFVLNSGDTGEGVGGGTYGFGKSSFFSASETGAVLVHTRCRENDRDESRLVAVALGRSHTHDGVNFTGRHWWGLESGDGVEPIRDVEADAWARELGLPGFVEGARGTTIALACPNLGGRTPQDAADWMREAMLWHLWPKMVTTDGGSPEMSFELRLDGAEQPVQNPDDHPVLKIFADALRRVERGDGDTETLIAKSIDKRAGRLSLRKTLAPAPRPSPVAKECGIDTAVHHTCLLRKPRLVVQYLAGDAPADPSVWYAGVFKAFDDVNRTYAASEPPTHDEWVASQLEGEDKTLINSTARQLKQHMRDFVRPALSGESNSPFVALGAASRYFADLLGSVSGEGAGVAHTTGTSGGHRKPVRLVGEPRWEKHSDRDVLVQDVEVQPQRPTLVRPQLTINAWGGGSVTDEGLEADDESETQPETEPRFLAWRRPDGALHPDARQTFDADDAGLWQMMVDPVPETVTGFAIKAEAAT